ncbi:MAG TPA: GntR family transcriptional regulator [Acidimicrobiales bacterium]|jgi:DNA-binding FadR family transcriptional regulator|nr:GntR family transcriptional regulator [Acidimicrobiales bacterium]
MALQLEPLERRTVADEVFERLLEEIRAGQVSAGDPLPAERALSEQLGVNRQAVREALQRLAQAGLVDIRQGGLTRVRDFRHAAGLDLLPRLLLGRDGVPDPSVIRSVMELRATLGPDIAARCAERASVAVAAELREALAELVATPRVDTVERAERDLRFWECLVEGADNVAYRLAFNSLRQVYEPVLPVLAGILADEFGDLDDHRAIVAAVADRDPATAQDAAWALLARGTAAMESVLESLSATEGAAS